MKSLSGTLPLLLFLTCLASPLDANCAQTGGLRIVGPPDNAATSTSPRA